MRSRVIRFLLLCAAACVLLSAAAKVAAATLTVTKTADTADGTCDADCSLREAIGAAVFGDTIQFAALFDTPQTITLAGTELPIDTGLTIIGPGADKLTLSGNAQSGVFHVHQPGQLSLSGMTITGGSADVGGGIFNEGSLTVSDCHITANTAGSGGGIGSHGGGLTVRNSTISNNTAYSRGGGLEFDDFGFGFELQVISSTISGNTLSSLYAEEGGGLWAVSHYALLHIRNSTITDNFPGGAFAGVVGGDMMDISSSIIAANRNNSAVPDFNWAGFDGGISDNLIGNAARNSSLLIFHNILGDSVVQADPKLGALANNGGTTPTHALLPCSLAIDDGSALVATDQRGFDRIRDGDGDGIARADIGAFELQTFTPAVCNTGPPTITATDLTIEQDTSARMNIATVDDPDGLYPAARFGAHSVYLYSANPSNDVQLSNLYMFSFGIFSADISASCEAATADFTLRVDDGEFEASDTLTVTVAPETSPPVIVGSTDPLVLFPNDHKYRTVYTQTFVGGVSDNCDSNVNLDSIVITQVTSDEPENAPAESDGNTLNDIVIAPDCKSVQLRVERDGNRDGRVYTVTMRARDASGNSATATGKVSVPLSQNGDPAIEGAPQYTVTSNCL